MKTYRPASAFALLIAVTFVACEKKEPPPPPPTPAPAPTAAPTPVPFKITAVDLGKSIRDDKTIKDGATTFTPKETIYVALTSQGAAAKVTLKVRWTFGPKGTLVNEETRDIAPTGPSVTEFHISKPSGLSVGQYNVEVSADGAVVMKEPFEVHK